MFYVCIFLRMCMCVRACACVSVCLRVVFIRYIQLNYINTLRPRRNRRHFVDDIFKCIFLNENVLILIKMWPKFVLVNNIRAGVKLSSEPIMIRSLTHVCVTLPQWIYIQPRIVLQIIWSCPHIHTSDDILVGDQGNCADTIYNFE